MYGYIYKTTNIINNKIYIGQHKTNFMEKDEKYFGSGLYLNRAIKKYGIDNFKNEIICWCETKEELDTAEKYWINKLNSCDKNIGYNIQIGGQGGFSHIDVKGTNNPMYGIHRYGADNPNFNKHWSDDSKIKMSKTIKENGGHHKEKNPMWGKKHSEESKHKMKQSKLDKNGEYKYKGKNAVNYGKHEDHPCFGLHWWCDGVNPPIKSKTCPGDNYHRGRK